MPRFSATQYDHFKSRFRSIIKNKVAALGENEELSQDEKTAMVLGGKAKIAQDRLMPKNGSCPRGIETFLSFFDFHGEEIMTAKNIALDKKRERVRTKLKERLDDLLEQYVVGLLPAEKLLAEIKEIEKK